MYIESKENIYIYQGRKLTFTSLTDLTDAKYIHR